MNSNKLRGEIVSQGFTLAEFSKASGIKVTSLYRKLKGLSEFDRAEIEAIIGLLHLSPEQTENIFFTRKVS